MTRSALTLLLTASASFSACSSTPARTARPPSPGARPFTVMTYNVNFGLAGDPEALELIARSGADVVFLQETTPPWEHAIRGALAGRYPAMSFHHSGGAGGLAVLARRPFGSVRVLAAEHGWFPAQHVVIETDDGPIQILSVHLRPQIGDSGSVLSGYFTTPKVRRAEVTDFSRALEPDLPALIVGDFNESKSGSAIEILEERGFRNALAEFSPDADTWRWSTSIGQIELDLDHILYDAAALEPIDAKVIQAGRSDHLPVLATFERVR